MKSFILSRRSFLVSLAPQSLAQKIFTKYLLRCTRWGKDMLPSKGGIFTLKDLRCGLDLEY